MAVFWRPPSQGRMGCEPGAPPHQDRALAWAGLMASCGNVFPCCRQGPTATVQGCMQASGPVSAARNMAMGMVPTVEADLALSSLRAECSSVSDWPYCFLGNSNTEMQWGSGAQRGLAICSARSFPQVKHPANPMSSPGYIFHSSLHGSAPCTNQAIVGGSFCS